MKLDELRDRLPNLRKRSEALQAELRSLEATAVDQQTFLRLAENIGNFLERLRCNADTLDVSERQKILRLVVKEILVHKETIKIKHSIPITGTTTPSGPSGRENVPSYLLRSGSPFPAASQSLSASCRSDMGASATGAATRCTHRPLRGRYRHSLSKGSRAVNGGVTGTPGEDGFSLERDKDPCGQCSPGNVRLSRLRDRDMEKPEYRQILRPCSALEEIPASDQEPDHRDDRKEKDSYPSGLSCWTKPLRGDSRPHPLALQSTHCTCRLFL